MGISADRSHRLTHPAQRRWLAALWIVFLTAFGGRLVRAEDAPLPDSPGAVAAQAQQHAPPATTAASDPAAASAAARKAQLEGQQTKRIFGVIPNFRSVSVNDKFAPLSPKEKFKLSFQNAFDYSAFLSTGASAGISQWRDTYPEFGQGAAGYGRRYWHTFTTQVIASETTVFILPVITREDPRYFTLGHGTFKQRTWYAVSRLGVARSDTGKSTANISEILGRGSAAAISVFYYPSNYQTFSEVATRWGTYLGGDAGFFVLKEFWPEIRYKLTRGKK
jgi:hypothetical protein